MVLRTKAGLLGFQLNIVVYLCQLSSHHLRRNEWAYPGQSSKCTKILELISIGTSALINSVNRRFLSFGTQYFFMCFKDLIVQDANVEGALFTDEIFCSDPKLFRAAKRSFLKQLYAAFQSIPESCKKLFVIFYLSKLFLRFLCRPRSTNTIERLSSCLQLSKLEFFSCKESIWTLFCRSLYSSAVITCKFSLGCESFSGKTYERKQDLLLFLFADLHRWLLLQPRTFFLSLVTPEKLWAILTQQCRPRLSQFITLNGFVEILEQSSLLFQNAVASI